MVEMLKLGNKTVVIGGKTISLFKKGVLLRQLYYGGYEDFDNANGGVWIKYIHIPITAVPHEDAVYKLVIDSTNVSLYLGDGTLKTSSNIASEFWNLVRFDGYDIRVFDHLFRQLYFWVETFDYNNQYAEIWIKLPANSEALNIAFGNSSANQSNYNNLTQVHDISTDFEQSFDSFTPRGTAYEFVTLPVKSGQYSLRTYDAGEDVGGQYSFIVPSNKIVITLYVYITGETGWDYLTYLKVQKIRKIQKIKIKKMNLFHL